MSRKFNGTSQAMSVAIDLSAYAQASVSFWLWADTNLAASHLPIEYGTPNADTNPGGAGFLLSPGTTTSTEGIAKVTGTPQYWLETFPIPSAAAWHHYVLTHNRATPVNTVYIDGVLQTLTTSTHNVVAYGNFANGSLYLMSRGGTTFFKAGRMAHLALFGGTILTARQALALSTGWSPMRIGPMPTAYWPLFGDSGEPDYGGLRKTLTLIATPTIVAHPPVFARAF